MDVKVIVQPLLSINYLKSPQAFNSGLMERLLALFPFLGKKIQVSHGKEDVCVQGKSLVGN